MSIGYLITGILFVVVGIILLIWSIKKTFYNDDDDDGSIESGAWQWTNKIWDKESIIGSIGMIIIGIVCIYKGIIV